MRWVVVVDGPSRYCVYPERFIEISTKAHSWPPNAERGRGVSASPASYFEERTDLYRNLCGAGTERMHASLAMAFTLSASAERIPKRKFERVTMFSSTDHATKTSPPV